MSARGLFVVVVVATVACADRAPDVPPRGDATVPAADTAPRVEPARDSAPRTSRVCELPASRDDRTICPSQRVGPIQPATTRAELASLFGPDAIRDERVHVGEGEFQPGTRINIGRPDSASVVWVDSTRTRVAMVLALGPAWRTPEGLGVGSSLAELEAALGPLSIMGFGWDYGGTVSLAGTRYEDSGVFFRTQPRSDDARGTPAYDRVRGEQSFASTDPDVRALDPIVRRMDVIW